MKNQKAGQPVMQKDLQTSFNQLTYNIVIGNNPSFVWHITSIESRMNFSKIWLGKTSEQMAMQFLKKKGYFIRQKNFRSKFGEIDLIAEKDNKFVFIEVKSLQFSKFFSPEDHFDYRKQRKQILLAKHYLYITNRDVNVRFDLITVVKKGRDFFIEHYEDVIQE